MNVKEKFEMGVKEVTDARVKERNEYVLKSQEAFQRGKFEEAINYIVKASVIDSFNPKIWLSKAQLCELVGDPLEALDCYVKALILSPKDLEAQDGRDRLLALTPEQMEALKWMKKGQRAHQKGQIEEALALVEKALEYGPLDSKVWDYKGVVLYDLMQPQAALACYEKALELDPRNFNAWMHKGVAYDPSPESIECFDKALAIKPNNPEVLYNKGVKLREMGRFREAIECLDKVLAIQPDNLSAFTTKELALRGVQGPPSYGRSLYAHRRDFLEKMKKEHPEMDLDNATWSDFFGGQEGGWDTENETAIGFTPPPSPEEIKERLNNMKNMTPELFLGEKPPFFNPTIYTFSETPLERELLAYDPDSLLGIQQQLLRGEVKEAFESCQDALTAAQTSGNMEREVILLGLMAFICWKESQLNETFMHLYQALQLAQELGYRSGEMICYNYFYLIYRSSGDLDKALSYLTLGLKIAEELGEVAVQIDILKNSSEIYLRKKEFLRAQEQIQAAIELAQANGNKEALLSALNALGALYYEQGAWNDASNAFNEAYTAATELGDLIQTLGALKYLELIAEQKGDPVKVTQYRMEYLKALQKLQR